MGWQTGAGQAVSLSGLPFLLVAAFKIRQEQAPSAYDLLWGQSPASLQQTAGPKKKAIGVTKVGGGALLGQEGREEAAGMTVHLCLLEVGVGVLSGAPSLTEFMRQGWSLYGLLRSPQTD